MITTGNSRMGRVLPDVAPVDVPLIADILALVTRLGDGACDVREFQHRVIGLLSATDPRQALAPYIAEALATKSDQTLARRSWPDHDYTLQILYVAPGEVHPCHCHHNVISTQVVTSGALIAREYDRIDRRNDGLLRLKLLYDGTLEAGDYLQATDADRNAHWFAALDTPATIFNFNIRGYERITFYPYDLRPLGRRLLDPTRGLEDGYLLAAQIDVAAAYAKFGDAPLSAFPCPVPASDAAPRSLPALVSTPWL